MEHFIAFDLVIPCHCRFPEEKIQKQRKSTKVSNGEAFCDRGGKRERNKQNTLNTVHMSNTRGMAKQMMVILCHWEIRSF